MVDTSGSGTLQTGVDTNLSAMTRPAQQVVTNASTADTGTLNFTTGSDANGCIPQPALPTWPIALATFVPAATSDVVALASGRAFQWGAGGDAMMGIHHDGLNDVQGPGGGRNYAGTWSVNDLYYCAETQGPFYSHAFIQGLTGGVSHNVSYNATEFPWYFDFPRCPNNPGACPNCSNPQGHSVEDTIQYRAGSTTRVIGLIGGMSVKGFANLSPGGFRNRTDWACIASSTGWPGCPPVPTQSTFASGTVNIPAGHNGVVMFSAKTRAQGDSNDPGGATVLNLFIDGVRVGSTGVQGIARVPNTVDGGFCGGDSQRTLTLSYLATGANGLAPGNHQVELRTTTLGNFMHLSYSRDLPLVWFD